jgi:hypothetical protein
MRLALAEEYRVPYRLRGVRIRGTICLDRCDIVTQSMDFVCIEVQSFELSSVAAERRAGLCWNSSRNGRQESFPFGNIRTRRRWLRHVLRRVRTVSDCNDGWLTVCKNCRRSLSNIRVVDIISRRPDGSGILRVATNTSIVFSGKFSSHKCSTRRIVEITELLTKSSSFRI